MAVNFEVKVDEQSLAEARSFFEFIGGNTEDVIRIAINKAGPVVRTEASKQIRTQVRLTAKYVRNRLTFTRATRQQLSGAIRTPSRGILLSRFSTDSLIANSGTKVSWLKPPPVPTRGIKVKVKPNGPVKTVTGGNEIVDKPFYMVLPYSGALGIVGRRAGLGRQGGEIKVFHGPSLSQVFNDVRDDVLPYASEVYTKQQVDAMRYLLRNRRLPT